MEPLSTLIFSIYKGTPKHGAWMVACLEGAWHQLLGGRIAGVCRPIVWENHCLTVEIQNPEWRESLEKLQDQLLERIRDATGDEVRQLRFRIAVPKRKP